MCLISLAIEQSLDHPLILAANRDEFFNRPTAALSQWPGDIKIYAGKDLTAGGTWLGINQNGRWAALTNFRSNSFQQGPISRGEIIVNALSFPSSLKNWFTQLSYNSHQYSGFNIIAGETKSQGEEVYYYSNRNQLVTQLEPGYYALSNGLLSEDWPKMKYIRDQLKQAVESNQLDASYLLQQLAFSDHAHDHELPDTGFEQSLEKQLSGAFVSAFKIKEQWYGTRSSTIIKVDKKFQCDIHEVSYDTEGQIKETKTLSTLLG